VLAGRPNVGKSTLLNALVGEHLSIVSPKAQTTRERVSGILTSDAYQVLFVDGPGLIEPSYALQASMRWSALKAIEDADVVAYVSDATRPDTLPDADLADATEGRSLSFMVAINKIDLVDEGTEAELARQVQACGYEVVSISALTGAGLDQLLGRIVPLLPESPPLFPPENSATQPVRFFAEEFVRETCLDLFREEVPYSIVCRVEEFREEQDPVYIRAIIYVERESQKGIVIGRGGSAIKTVGEISRAKIESLIARRAYLELRVKVMPSWPRKRGRLRQLGFGLPPNAHGGQRRR
jgi:GTP-binding protein Era